MKIQLNGRRVEDIEDIQAEPQAVMDSVKKQEFQRCFRQWRRCLVRCINSEVGSFEGDKTDL
jgi:hypothetical protein